MNLSHGFFFPIHGKILESMSLHAPLEKRECHVPGEEDSPDVGWYSGKCISHAADDDIFEYGRAFEVRRLVRRVAPEVTVPHELKWKCKYCKVVNVLDQYLSCFVLSKGNQLRIYYLWAGRYIHRNGIALRTTSAVGKKPA